MPWLREGSARFIWALGPTDLFYVAAPLAAVWFGRRSWLGLLLVLCVVSGGILLKATAYGGLD